MNHNVIVTISRQYGSGGRVIGKMLAERLDIPFYDKELISLAAKDSGYDENVLTAADERASSSLLYSLSMGMPVNGLDHMAGMSMNDRLYIFQSRVIRDAASRGSCVIVGRCADYIPEENPDLVSVFIHSSLKNRVKRAVERYGVPPERAESIVLKTDKRRAAYYDYYTGTKWGRIDNYDLSIDSDFVGFDNTVEILSKFVECRGNRD